MKIWAQLHIRKGPNKVGFIGISQPFRDAIKLFTDDQVECCQKDLAIQEKVIKVTRIL